MRNYPLPLRERFRFKTMTEEQKDWFREYYPNTVNRDIAKMMHVSMYTVVRVAQRLGVQKNYKHIIDCHRISGKASYEKNIRPKREKGWSPVAAMRTNRPAEFEAYRQRLRLKWKNAWKVDKWRLSIGLPPINKFVHSLYCYTSSQGVLRYRARQRNYILGDTNEKFGERYTIYYDAATERSERIERMAARHNFSILPLPE